MRGKYLQDSLFSSCKSCCWLPVCLHLKSTSISGSLQAVFFFISDVYFKCQCILLNGLSEALLRFLYWPNRYVWESSDTKVCRSASVSNLVLCFDHLILKVLWGNVLCLLMTSFCLLKSVPSSFVQSEMLWLYYWHFRNTGLILLQSLS